MRPAGESMRIFVRKCRLEGSIDMSEASKKEKMKRKLAKKREKRLRKRVRRITRRMEATVSFFAVFLCIIFVTMETLEERKR